jgi:M6 family metalloprotease-like protein
MSLATSGILCSRARLGALCLVVTTACGDGSGGGGIADAHDDAGGPAPGRRALAVIADFAGTRLEDWHGPGFDSVAKVRAQLDAMSDHWRFLRRGLETVGWSIVRVQVPQAVTGDAFATSRAFRDEVVKLAAGQLDVTDYDFDGDGVIDTVWIIAATGGQAPAWTSGETSSSSGANVFVDRQDSARVQAGATGELNHDVGVTRGLRDLHGDLDNVGDLSLMANCARQPPNDFSAYDRLHLGWLVPRLVGTGAATIDIADANDALVAFEVTTARPDELFLLEYRRRPASGYASAAITPFDGFVVYHVLEGSDQSLDPPLLRVEGILGPGAAPLVLRSYAGSEVFSVDAVRSGPPGSLEADLTVLPLDSGF